MSGYTKLFGSILDSSIWQEADHVRIVWITMLAMKDRYGIVEASLPGLAHRAGKTIEETRDALRVLLAPDPHSRTPDREGRRIEVIDGGWQILNHDKYREKESEIDRRRKVAERVRKHRDRVAIERKMAERAAAAFTYLIVQDGAGFMKIGQSLHPEIRLTELQVASPMPLRLVSRIPGDHEAYLHAELAAHRVSGEWFRHTPETEAQALQLMASVTSVTVTPVTPDSVTGNPSNPIRSDQIKTDTGSGIQRAAPGGGLLFPQGSGSGSDHAGSGASGSSGGGDLHQPADRGAARAAGGRVPVAPKPPVARVVPNVPPPGAVAGDPEVRARQRLVERFRDAINAARRELAAELKLTGVREDIPLHGGENENELRARLREAGSDAADQLEHVIAVAVTEARAARSVQWLGWSLGRSRSWTLALQKSAADANGTKRIDGLEYAMRVARGEIP